MKDGGGGARLAGVRQACLAGCCPHGTTEGCPPDLPDAPESERIAHLYACQLLSTYQIGRITDNNRQRVNWVLRKAGVAVNPRGTGRPRGGRDDQARHLDELMADLYLRLSTTQIAGLVGIPANAVRYRLLARGVPMRTRGGNNREDRIVIHQAELAELYLQAGLSADEVGQVLGVSRRVVLRSAHDAGLPVRVGGAPPGHGPSEIELIQALYADSHGVRGAHAARDAPGAATRADLAAILRTAEADCGTGHGPVFRLRARSAPHRAAHGSARRDRERPATRERGTTTAGWREVPIHAPLARKRLGDAVPGAAGDLGGGHADLQCQRHARVPQVVRPPGERGGLLGGEERGCAGLLPDGTVGAVLDEPAACDEEDPPVGCGAVPLEVVAEHLDQDRPDGDGPGFVLGAVLEAPGLAGGAVVAPVLADPGSGGGQVDTPQPRPGSRQSASFSMTASEGHR